MNADEIVGELQRRCEANTGAANAWPNAGDVRRWTGGVVEAECRLLNEIGVVLAREYEGRRLSFEFCDGVVNGLFAALVEGQFQGPQPPWPDLFYEVFLAFDAGEFHRRKDKSDNPVKDHTDPAIRKIVERLSLKPA